MLGSHSDNINENNSDGDLNSSASSLHKHHQDEEQGGVDHAHGKGAVEEESSLTPSLVLLEGKAEQRAVFWLKLVLIAILVTSTIAVALLVFFYTRENETTAFETRFSDEARKVLDAVGNGFYLSLGALDSYVVDLVSYAEDSNLEWPYVALPHYAVRASKLRSLSKAFYVGQYHLVTNETRSEWEEFSLSNDSWVNEVLQIQKEDTNFHGKLLDTYEPYGVIHNNEGDAEGPGPFLPAWHSYPLIPYVSSLAFSDDCCDCIFLLRKGWKQISFLSNEWLYIRANK